MGIFSTILNSIMDGWKYELRELLKVIFLSPKNKRADLLCMKFSLTFNTVCRGAYIFYFKINAPIFCCFIFFEECLNSQVRINKMVNKYTVDYHPSPSELTSRMHSLIFLCTPKRFLFPEYPLIFFSNRYIPPWLQKIFKFMC